MNLGCGIAAPGLAYALWYLALPVVAPPFAQRHARAHGVWHI